MAVDDRKESVSKAEPKSRKGPGGGRKSADGC